MITILHNGECSKSNAALEILREAGVPHEVRNYLAEPLTAGEIKSLLQKLGLKAFDIVRKSEPLYREKYEGREVTEEEWPDILTAAPVLIERPIVVNGDKALIARPPERVKEIL